MSGRAALNVFYSYQVRRGVDAGRVQLVDEWLDDSRLAERRSNDRRLAVLAAGGEVR